mmetsp:Transcript_13989/g.39827  ORF Transcript_13989/g.39827 Transcript_13989/m.39827 type:complete len:421 (-) Transcript_13989:286-1548(-)|eukprot:CAMPEP_0119545688 /NCGR_PEP_ID=MMETSP1352-20130426/365_1 /TAXON_ID=265584 /ORGANISM="Stauroneis constricta, Strain CCMP1120" /LENGTH=420 /DNA_ID=CAMNT_0007590269 /DNA_START=117 /DNA_END=1379 /DNA_ORIENTATION=-
MSSNADTFDDEDVRQNGTSLSSGGGGGKAASGGSRVVGIPCNVSICLGALLVVIVLVTFLVHIGGNAMSSSNSKTKDSQFGIGGGPSASDSDLSQYFPQGVKLTSCDKDANCQMIERLVLDANPDLAFETSCQTQARDWVRFNDNIASLSEERIRTRYALAVFFCETDGPNWSTNKNWLDGALHECDWYTKLDQRIDPCNRDEQLRVLRLDGNQLRGTIPPEISLLTTLFEFTVSDNFLQSTIPTEMAALSDLDTLGLSLNLFDDGPLPEFIISDFEDMVYLDFAYNSWTGTLPSTYASNDIEIFYGEYNDLSGTIPPTLLQMPLERLSLNGNAFSGTVDGSAWNCVNLERIYLQENDLDGIMDFDQLLGGECDQLSTLVVEKNPKLEGTIETCGNLQEVSVEGTQIECSCCETIAKPSV